MSWLVDLLRGLGAFLAELLPALSTELKKPKEVEIVGGGEARRKKMQAAFVIARDRARERVQAVRAKRASETPGRADADPGD